MQGPNIVRLLDWVRDTARTNYLVFEYVREARYHRLYPALAAPDAALYLYKLLLVRTKTSSFYWGGSIAAVAWAVR